MLSPPPPPAFHHVITILSLYKRNYKDNQPEILIVGGFIIRSVILPGAYCLPGDRVYDMLELCLVLTDPPGLIFHGCTNDIMKRQSIELCDQPESLAVTVWSLGKNLCFFWSQPSSFKKVKSL